MDYFAVQTGMHKMFASEAFTAMNCIWVNGTNVLLFCVCCHKAATYCLQTAVMRSIYLTEHLGSYWAHQGSFLFDLLVCTDFRKIQNYGEILKPQMQVR